MEGVSEQSLKNLERDPHRGAEAKSRTVIQVVRVFWPDVSLSDLIPDCPFELVPARRPGSLGSISEVCGEESSRAQEEGPSGS